MTEPNFDHEQLDVYRVSIDYVAASYGIAKALRGGGRPVAADFRWLESMCPG